jgi:serine/threonine protein kinase
VLTGRHAFANHVTTEQMIAAQVSERPAPLNAPHPAEPVVPPALAALVMSCLAKDPASRVESAHALLTALDDPKLLSMPRPGVSQVPVSFTNAATMDVPIVRTPRPTWKTPLIIGIVLVLVSALVLALEWDRISPRLHLGAASPDRAAVASAYAPHARWTDAG